MTHQLLQDSRGDIVSSLNVLSTLKQMNSDTVTYRRREGYSMHPYRLLKAEPISMHDP